jgi:hypothetical protein
VSLTVQAGPTGHTQVVVPLKSVAAIKDALHQCQADPMQLREAARHSYAEACKMHAYGRVLVVASLSGELLFYENVGAPQWA